MFNRIKNFLVILVVLVVAAVAAWNVNFNSPMRNFSDTMLANVEALANDENNENSGDCKWHNIQCPFPSKLGYGVCIKNGDGTNCSCGDTTHDPLPC